MALGYMRTCQATKKNGDPCSNIMYVNEDGRCSAHRDAEKFPISQQKLDQMMTEEVYWALRHEYINDQFRDTATKLMEQFKSDNDFDEVVVETFRGLRGTPSSRLRETVHDNA